MQMRPTASLARLARAQFVEFQDVAALDHHHVADRAMHRSRHLRVQLELAVFAVNRNEILRLHQVDDQLQLFLAGVSADVHRRRRAVVVNHMRIAAEEVIDDAIDRLLIAGNDARRKHHRVARLNARVLVIINRGARQRRHRLALRAADQHANFFRRQVADLRRMNQHPVGHVDVAQVLRDLCRLHHRAADQRNLAAVLERLRPSPA